MRLTFVFEPGFFASAPVRTALLVGTISAVVSGVVGTFTVLRGQSFAGHSLADVGTAGGSAAVLVGVNPLLGFVAMNVAAASVMELLGVRRPRGRDVATGIVLGASLGLAALFLYLDTTSTSANGATVSVLFGSIFTLAPSLARVSALLAVAALGLIASSYRPLLLASLHADLATARGVRVRLVGVAFLAALALAVSLSAITIGAVLSTALLIGPAAAALRVTRRTGAAMAAAVAFACLAVWLGVLLSYDSYYWSGSHADWPVSFFVVSVCAAAYVCCDVAAAVSSRRQRGRA